MIEKDTDELDDLEEMESPSGFWGFNKFYTVDVIEIFWILFLATVGILLPITIIIYGFTEGRIGLTIVLLLGVSMFVFITRLVFEQMIILFKIEQHLNKIGKEKCCKK